MKVSVNWVKQFTSIPADVDELVSKIGLQLGGVDEVIDVGAKYQDAIIAKVISAEKHPNADKLKLCFIDDGGAVKKADRDSRGYIQVVCGAPNVAAGQLVVWLPPGATVPNTYDKDPFVLEARELRGKVSNGMIASAKELAIGDDHSGIVVIDEDIKPGTPFAEAFELDDYIIDIENKMFTHRPDLFGILGIAREIAGIQHRPFKSPDWYREDIKLETDGRKNVLKLSVQNDIPELVPRFMAIAMKDVRVGPSHFKLQTFLSRVGIKPINNIVDATNFVMYLTGQPVHAYDYDKLATGQLGARLSKKGEKLKLIGGKQITLDEGAVVITDGRRPVGLGGVMGGADTEVDENTRSIVLECATFDMNLTRKTSMKYGLFTDAATRFTKGQSPLQNPAVIARLAAKVQKRAGGRLASPLIDKKAGAVKPPRPVGVTIGFINDRLGTGLTAAEVKKLLENVEFKVLVNAGDMTVQVPFWRTDIEIPEDIAEEVGRLYGYEYLPEELPRRSLSPAAKDTRLEFKTELRNIMLLAGGNEVLTYSFVNERLFKAAGQDPKEAYHIKNALSPDLQYYRLRLAPSLLEKVRPNVRSGYESFCLFEIGKSHVKDFLDGDKLPAEQETLAAAVVSPAAGAPYYQARALADYIFGKLNITERTYRLLADVPPKLKSTALSYYEPNRTAVIWGPDRTLGLIGEPTAKLKAALKLPDNVSILELEIPNLYEQAGALNYQPINKFPALSQDICLRLPAETDFDDADGFVRSELQKLAVKPGLNFELSTLDIFQRTEDKNHKQITWRITLSHPERTLTTAEANKLLDGLAAAAKKDLKADRV